MEWHFQERSLCLRHEHTHTHTHTPSGAACWARIQINPWKQHGSLLCLSSEHRSGGCILHLSKYTSQQIVSRTGSKMTKTNQAVNVLQMQLLWNTLFEVKCRGQLKEKSVFKKHVKDSVISMTTIITQVWAHPKWDFWDWCQYPIKFWYPIYWLILYTYIHVWAECGYQIPVTKTYNGGRISYILTNISALNSKHFTCYF